MQFGTNYNQLSDLSLSFQNSWLAKEAMAHAPTIKKVALAGLVIATVAVPVLMKTPASTAVPPLPPSLLNVTQQNPFPPNTCPNFPINFDEIDTPVNLASNITQAINETIIPNVTQAAQFVKETVFSNVTQATELVNEMIPANVTQAAQAVIETISADSTQTEDWDLGSIALQTAIFPFKASWEVSKFISEIATPLHAVTSSIPMPIRAMMKTVQGVMLFWFNRSLSAQREGRIKASLIVLEFLNEQKIERLARLNAALLNPLP